MSYGNKHYKPVELPDSGVGEDVPSIAAKPKETKFLDGDEAGIESILNIPLVFTDWIVLPSRYGEEGKEFVKLQFIAKDGLRTVTSGSTYLIDQVKKQEKLIPEGGDRRFKAVIRKHGRAFIFEAVK
ncbi:MAG: hypothetical protein PUC15_08065 [Lentisphaeria bacterium]|nr:hypothetical protein [Lentisphaeria bacterium]